MTGTAGLSHLPRRRRIVNALTARVVALGGAAVIAAIALIFFYLLWVVAPIFAGADIEPGVRYQLDEATPLLVEANDSEEIGLRIDAGGTATFFEIDGGAVRSRVDLGRPLTRVQALADQTGIYALVDDAGEMTIVQATYPVSFDDDRRVITPNLDYVYEDVWFEVGEADAFDVHSGNFEVLVASISGRTLTVQQFQDAEPGFALEFPRRGRYQLRRSYDRVFFGPRGRWAYAVSLGGAVEVVDLARPNRPTDMFAGRLVPEGERLNDVAPLLGRYSLLAADQHGRISQWFMVRGEFGQELEQARHFDLEAPARQIIPEPRRKGFAAVDAEQRLHLFYTTSSRHLARHPMAVDDVAAASIAPRSDLLLAALPDGSVQSYHLDNEHPEISWSTLWSKIWYEGYQEPVYSWQSSSAETDFEPKFSLTPLLFGTLKGAFYAMVVAVPVAIMGALYTAYFMAPAMRRIVKPGIEIMAALPTVILGFLAGLWLAPLIEANLTAVLAILVVMPIGTLVAAWAWSRLPERLTRPFRGWYGLLVLPVILGTIWISFAIGPVLEQALFGGNVQAWILENLGLNYDQRNALVVGLAMGLAVIPTVFSIAEDAIYGVPTHLINGSLALGATPWQTLMRVVILTASPGIFSAVMIGLGRAVGETMIVLMATGNTPVMDMNIFEGMRTFAANIAVELPETEVGSTHYRILFLAAMVLFMLTFLFNTVAEVVRQRLRTRYGNL
ncbi:MAG: phosphate ABC transporter permease [Gammaproteobacteria bacterium]|nr:phosphate ABC transporter permease [Gammaproteobacteria bacterium]|tara:strand:+ start:4979 stop:7165 length:2187 start_codon:yes stop_codon:yes gene_type:complete